MAGAKVVIVGATGLVGGHALRCALASDEVATVVSIGRRETGEAHDKLTEVVHADLGDYAGLDEAFAGVDVALFCVGAYTGVVDDEEFRRITVDLALAFGRAVHTANPKAALSFLSGAGADPSGRSRYAFARYKGEAETALRQLGLRRVHVFRPGYIYPVQPRKEPNALYRVMRAVYPALRPFLKGSSIRSDELGEAMVVAALHGTGAHSDPVLENKEIRAFVAAQRERES